MAVLGAGGVLAAVLTGAGAAALAPPASARALTLPEACVAIEALGVGGVSGPGLGGEVLTVLPGVQGTLTASSAPAGGAGLDAPGDMAFRPGGDIVIAGEGLSGRRPDVAEAGKDTGARTLVSGSGPGPGPAPGFPALLAVEASGDILVAGQGGPGTRLLRITPATGDRGVLSARGTGTGPALSAAPAGLAGGVIYLMDQAGQIMSVDPLTGARTLVSGPARGTGPGLFTPVSMTSNPAAPAVVPDMDQPAGAGQGPGALIRAGPATGSRTLLSSDAAPAGGQQFGTSIDVQDDACEKAFYVLEPGSGTSTGPGRVLKADAATGARTTVRPVPGRGELRPAPSPDPGQAARRRARRARRRGRLTRFTGPARSLNQDDTTQYRRPSLPRAHDSPPGGIPPAGGNTPGSRRPRGVFADAAAARAQPGDG